MLGLRFSLISRGSGPPDPLLVHSRIGQMARLEYRDIVAKYELTLSSFYCVVRDAALELSHERPQLDIKVISGTGWWSDSTIQATRSEVLTHQSVLQIRSNHPSCTWRLFLGSEDEEFVTNAVDWDTDADLPPLRLPVRIHWQGMDQWTRVAKRTIECPPLTFIGDEIHWDGRHWNVSNRSPTKDFLERLVDTWLQHSTLQAARFAESALEPSGRWQKVREIARSGQGILYEVRDRDRPDEPHAVLKAMKWRKSKTSTAYQRVLREIEITRTLAEQHEGIVPVIDFGVPEDEARWAPFYVMPQAVGSLAGVKYLKNDIDAVLSIGAHLADVLLFAHRAGVIHRDVKPENVLLFGETRIAKLADFGICYVITPDDERLTEPDDWPVGSREYIAPELLAGRLEDADGRVDVYSLGKTLYYLLSGGRLFPREEFDHSRFDLRSSSDLRMGHFYGVLQRMTVRDRDDRFSMEECRDALRRALVNIRSGVPYRPGMYDKEETPAEAMVQLTHTLTTSSGLERSDAIVAAVNSSIDAAEFMADEWKPDTTHSRREAENDPSAKLVALEIAERLLSVGLPLVLSDDSDAFDEWVSRAVAPLFRDGPQYDTSGRTILRGAAILAIYGASALAWKRRRLSALRIMVDAYGRDPGKWIHVSLIGRSAGAITPWVVESLNASEVLRRADEQLSDDPLAGVAVFSGLSALKVLATIPQEQLEMAVSRKGDSLPAFPALYSESAVWVHRLASALSDSRALERDVSRQIFDSSVEDFRKLAARLTPILASWSELLARERGQMVHWNMSFDGSGTWLAWTGQRSSVFTEQR